MKNLLLILSLLLITTNCYSYELTEYTCNNVYDKVNCNESCKTIKDLKFFNVFTVDSKKNLVLMESYTKIGNQKEIKSFFPNSI